jgi:hypothetical protein
MKRLKWLLISIAVLIVMPAWAIPGSSDSWSSAPARPGSEREEVGPGRVTDDQRRDGAIWRGKQPMICLMYGCPKDIQKPVICLMKDKRRAGNRDACERKPWRVIPLDPQSSLERVEPVRSAP